MIAMNADNRTGTLAFAERMALLACSRRICAGDLEHGRHGRCLWRFLPKGHLTAHLLTAVQALTISIVPMSESVASSSAAMSVRLPGCSTRLGALAIASRTTILLIPGGATAMTATRLSFSSCAAVVMAAGSSNPFVTMTAKRPPRGTGGHARGKLRAQVINAGGDIHSPRHEGDVCEDGRADIAVCVSLELTRRAVHTVMHCVHIVEVWVGRAGREAGVRSDKRDNLQCTITCEHSRGASH